MERAVSVSPEGEEFPLPNEEDYSREFERLQALVAEQRDKGTGDRRCRRYRLRGGRDGRSGCGCGGRKGCAHEIRHRHAASEREKLLEDPADEPRAFLR